jgi:hypothetical protein
MNSNDVVLRTDGTKEYEARHIVEGGKSETPTVLAPGSLGDEDARAYNRWADDGGNNLD